MGRNSAVHVPQPVAKKLFTDAGPGAKRPPEYGTCVSRRYVSISRLIGGLRQMATKRGWVLTRPTRGRRKKAQTPAPRELKKVKVLRLAIEYFETNQRYLRYDEYLRAGYPIGSGPAEGTCRHLVKDRMDNTGMRWTETGAQAMLDLRAIHISDQWSAFWPYHIQRETQRLYGHLDPTTLRFREAA